jgi:hypothetical protein
MITIEFVLPLAKWKRKLIIEMCQLTTINYKQKIKSLVENVALLISKYSKKNLDLDKRKKDHSIILEKLISTCPLWLGGLSNLAYVGTFD